MAIFFSFSLSARHQQFGLKDSGIGHFGDSSSQSDVSSQFEEDNGAENSVALDGMHPPHQTKGKQLQLPIRGLKNLKKEQAKQGLDEQQVSSLKYRIIKDNEAITNRFALMVLGVYRLLKQKQVPVDEVQIMLTYLGCTKENSTKEDARLFPMTEEFTSTKDILGLIQCLRKYSSWYNYRLVKVVAEEFADEEGKQLIASYEDDLRRHYVNLVAYQCPDFTFGENLPPGYTRLTIKVDWNHQSTLVHEIDNFQTSLADILELEPYVFLLQSVEEGCVILRWAIPAGLEPHFTNLSTQQKVCLSFHKVIYLEVASTLAYGEKSSLLLTGKVINASLLRIRDPFC